MNRPKPKPFTYTLPAGEYWIGDPCYPCNDAVYPTLWDDWLEQSDYFDGSGYAKSKEGFVVWAGGTDYGDGQYDDNHGRSYGVDAGLIGIMTKEHAIAMNGGDVGRLDGDLGHFVTFDKAFIVEFDNRTDTFDTSHRFGNVSIATSWEEEEE